MNTPRVWHYTVGTHAAKIIGEGVIRPALDAGLRQRSPVTWFSSRPSYEPTARKLWGNGIEPPRQLSTAECDTLCDGLYRFAVPIASALPWRACCAAAGISKAERIGLEGMGRAQGGDPADWYGVIGAVLLREVVAVEKWGDGWQPYPHLSCVT